MNRVRALCEHCYPSIEYPPDRTMATPANDSCVIEQAEDPWLRTTVEALLPAEKSLEGRASCGD